MLKMHAECSCVTVSADKKRVKFETFIILRAFYMLTLQRTTHYGCVLRVCLNAALGQRQSIQLSISMVTYYSSMAKLSNTILVSFSTFVH